MRSRRIWSLISWWLRPAGWRGGRSVCGPIERGQDLIALSRNLDETLTVFRQHRPRVMRALDTAKSSRTLRKRWRTPWNPSREPPREWDAFTKRLYAPSPTAAARNDLAASRCMATSNPAHRCWKTKASNAARTPGCSRSAGASSGCGAPARRARCYRIWDCAHRFSSACWASDV
jgi:hypothetical protein